MLDDGQIQGHCRTQTAGHSARRKLPWIVLGSCPGEDLFGQTKDDPSVDQHEGDLSASMFSFIGGYIGYMMLFASSFG